MYFFLWNQKNFFKSLIFTSFLLHKHNTPFSRQSQPVLTVNIKRQQKQPLSQRKLSNIGIRVDSKSSRNIFNVRLQFHWTCRKNSHRTIRQYGQAYVKENAKKRQWYGFLIFFFVFFTNKYILLIITFFKKIQ